MVIVNCIELELTYGWCASLTRLKRDGFAGVFSRTVMLRLTMFCTDAAAALNSELSWLERLTEKFRFSIETLAVYCWTSLCSRTHTLYSTHTHTHTHTHTRRDTHTQRERDTCTHTHTHTQTQTRRDTHTERETHKERERHMHTHTLTETCTQTHTNTHTHTDVYKKWGLSIGVRVLCIYCIFYLPYT